MSQVCVHTLVIVAKAGQNRMQHVGDIGMLTEEELDVVQDAAAAPAE